MSKGTSTLTFYNDVVRIHSRFVPLYLSDSIDMFRVEESLLELDALSALNEYGKTIVVSSLLASLFIGSYYKYPLYQYMYDNSKEIANKPVDLLILIQAIIEHLICVGMVTFLSIGLMFDITYSSWFGEAWCILPWYAGSFGVAYRTIGSLGIAILRLIHIKTAGMGRGAPSRIKLIVLFAGILVTSMVCIGYGLGDGPASRKQVLWNFCTGSSEAVREAVFNYSLARGLVSGESDSISKVALSIPALGVIAEFACYLLFFYHLYSHNEGMGTRKILPVVEVRKRHRKNAITFLGQFYCFLVECTITLAFFYTMQESSEVGYRACLIVGLWVEFGILSVIEVISSNTLNEKLPHNQFSK